MAEDLAEGVRTLAGRYEVGELVGRGGMADVYAGLDTRLGRKVAIKLLRANLAEDPQFRARFRREAQDAAKMAHPTIVRIFDAGEEAVHGGPGGERLVPFIVMEYIDGRLLSEVIAGEPLAPREAARIVEQVLIALEYSHRAGVIHRDIKPSNIMLTRNGQVKVMDFGIARAVSESAATLAETSKVVGTAQYFSPEQARGEQVDARTDLYSTGVVLFELLTGRAPFQGDNPVAIAYQHLNAEPPVPSTIQPAISPALDAVVLKSLAKDPSLRYQDAAEFRNDLAAAVNGQLDPRRIATARPDAFAATLFGPGAAAQAATQRQLTTEVDDRAMRTQSGPPVLWIWAGVVVLLAIVAAVTWWIVHLQPTDIAQGLTIEVPSIAGQPWDQVEGQLKDLGLNPVEQEQADDTVPKGTVVSSSPAAGNTVERGDEIDVIVSSGKAAVAVPDVARMDQATATQALQAKGFVVGQVIPATSPSIPNGAVIDAQYNGISTAGGATTAPSGATIDLTVSNGLVTVPDLAGEGHHTMEDATSTFQQLGLDISRNVDPSCTGFALKSQSLKGDVPQGSPITITVCGP